MIIHLTFENLTSRKTTCSDPCSKIARKTSEATRVTRTDPSCVHCVLLPWPIVPANPWEGKRNQKKIRSRLCALCTYNLRSCTDPIFVHDVVLLPSVTQKGGKREKNRRYLYIYIYAQMLCMCVYILTQVCAHRSHFCSWCAAAAICDTKRGEEGKRSQISLYIHIRTHVCIRVYINTQVCAHYGGMTYSYVWHDSL